MSLGKCHLTVATIGHIDSGKSTLCGRFLFELGGMSERELDKLRKAAHELGKESYLFAFFMDITKQERERGLSIDCITREFFTEKYHYTLIDLPGHRDFTKNMIKAASQTDVAILVVPADKTFEESIESKTNDQTVQHLLICHALGIEQIIVCINKMDDPSVNYKEDRFNEIKCKIQQLLTSFGYDINQIPIIPLSAFKGDNLIYGDIIYGDYNESMKWYKGFQVTINNKNVSGHSLVDALDKVIQKPQRFINEPFRMYVHQKWRIKGVGDVLCGKIQQGSYEPGTNIQFLPRHNVKGKGFSVEMHHKNMVRVESGDCMGINVKKLKRDNMPKIGDLMIIDTMDEDKAESFMNINYFVATIFVQYHPNKIKIGYEVSMHIATQRVQCEILSIHWKKRKSTDDKMVEYPQYVESGDNAEIVFRSQAAVIIYPFKKTYNPSLTKIIGLDWNQVIMFGKINDNAYDFCNKVLVYGYIRIEVEKKLKLEIVSDIQDNVAKYVCV